ncbi:HAD family phosphatase [Lachnospiraceae bacterium]|jgi:Cof subfamily protein (haloacid dehalogenase superfamily)|nr:HAD family hydrolase [uncultured Schaedlerella sp.]MCI9153245.1 HAD family phosphatase [Ruminococcus sp.]NBI57728.1 HAD family phosphatase [Lachnospiraceae bacterium]
MIKVIASDMDGTLLGEDHRLAPRTVQAIRRACDAGIRFMIATGRDLNGVKQELDGTGLVCDYIVGSGAEVRDPQQNIISRVQMDMGMCEEIYNVLRNYPVSTIFMTGECDYSIGTPETLEEDMRQNLSVFYSNLTMEEILETEMYRRMKENTRIIPDFQALKDGKINVYKIFTFCCDTEVLGELGRQLRKDERLAVASSFVNNLEITDARAQKGPVLKGYIESLGYTMDEVMAFGDSMNDYSMLSMDFGATVAMGNSEPEIIKAAKYLTKTNEEYGVAYTIEEMLKRRDN